MSCQLFVAAALASLAVTAAQDTADRDPPGIFRSEETGRDIAHRFSEEESRLLDEIQRACFGYFWTEIGSPAELVRDRKKAPVASVAAVGFQLSALPIGVECGWITREQGMARAVTVLEALLNRSDNKKFGLYLHYPDHHTAGLSHVGYEVLASTVDTALLIAGAIPAAEYFGGRVDSLVTRLIAEANWRAYATGPHGEVSMGWKPDDPNHMGGTGKFLKWNWHIASDEERLVYFLAVGSPVANHALDPLSYYRLKRVIKRHERLPPHVVSWNGALFTYVFSHCWIDYRPMGADDPSLFGVNAARVDWFENSRRAVLSHRQRCLEQSRRLKTLSEHRWGLSACSGRDGYLVPQVRPNLADKDSWHEGTVAPYAAVSSIMFTPRESLAAAKAFRTLTDATGKPLLWRDPAHPGQHGFVDAFNLDQGYASDDYVGIDVGPMLVAIENARTGLIWRLFMEHESARRAVERLRLTRRTTATRP